MPVWFFVRAPLGTNYTLTHVDYSYFATPFISVPSTDSLDLTTLDYDYLGRSFLPFAQG